MTCVLVTLFKGCTKLHLKNYHRKQICYEICGLLVHYFFYQKPKISNKTSIYISINKYGRLLFRSIAVQ